MTFIGVEGLGTGERQWMSLHYTVNNATGEQISPSLSLGRYAEIAFVQGGDAFVHVNGDKFRVRDLNVRAGLHHTVPISVVLAKKNVVSFSVESDDNMFEARLDGIEVLDGTEEEIEVKL